MNPSGTPSSQSSGVTPSWASRSTGAGFGGFQDLSGIEAKSIPSPAAVPNSINPVAAQAVQSPVALLPRQVIPFTDIQTHDLNFANAQAPADPNRMLPMGNVTLDPSSGTNWNKSMLDASLAQRHANMLQRQTQGADPRLELKDISDPKVNLAIAPADPNRFFKMDSTPSNVSIANAPGILSAPAATTPSVSTPPPSNLHSSVMRKANLTVYGPTEDEYANKTAAPGEDGQRFAQEGVTIAVDPSVIPYGSRVHIPALAQYSANKDGIFLAHDTGSAVKSRIAGKSRGNSDPVIDYYANLPANQLNALNKKLGYGVSYRILPKNS